MDVCDAVSHIHSHDIIHRDIKPENFVIDRDFADRVTMIDFGIAKHIGENVDDRLRRNISRENEFVGPLAFSSTEQINKRPDIDKRSDIFQTAKVLWFLATGVITAGIPSASLDPYCGRLHSLVIKALRDEPNERTRTVEDLRDGIAYLR